MSSDTKKRRVVIPATDIEEYLARQDQLLREWEARRRRSANDRAQPDGGSTIVPQARR